MSNEAGLPIVAIHHTDLRVQTNITHTVTLQLKILLLLSVSVFCSHIFDVRVFSCCFF